MHVIYRPSLMWDTLYKVTRRPIWTRIVPFLNLLSRCPERLHRDASLSRFVENWDLFSIFVNLIFLLLSYIGLFRSVYIGIFPVLLRSVQMLKRDWRAESNGKLLHLLIPSKTATLVPEFAVEDLPLGRTAALVPGFAAKDLPLGRTRWWWWWWWWCK